MTLEVLDSQEEQLFDLYYRRANSRECPIVIIYSQGSYSSIHWETAADFEPWAISSLRSD